MGSATFPTPSTHQVNGDPGQSVIRQTWMVQVPGPQVSLPPKQGKVPARRRRVEDGKLHFVQNLAKHPVSGVYLFRFSHRGQIHAGSTGCYRVNEARDFVYAM